MIPCADLKFETFMEEHEAAVLAYVQRRTKDPHAAEDLKQETFLRAYRVYLRGQVPVEPRSWLFRIAKNLLVDAFRKRGETVMRGDFDVEQDDAPEEEVVAPVIRLGSREFRRDELFEDLKAGIEQLPEPLRRVLKHRYHEGKSFFEIAICQGTSLDTAKVGLHRSRRRLKKILLSRIRDPQGFVNVRRME